MLEIWKTSMGAAVASAVVAVALAPAAQSASQCRPAGWTEVAKSEKGRVLIRGGRFTAADGGPAVRNRQRPSRNSGEAAGCLFADGKLRRLFPQTDATVDVLSTFVMTGSRVAYFADYRDDGSNADAYSEVIVDDLRTFEEDEDLRYLPEFQDDVSSSNSAVSFVAARIVLDGEGAVAWVACPARQVALCRRRGQAPGREVRGRRARGKESRPIARGAGIDTDRLSLKAGTVAWRQDGRSRSAAL